MRRNYVDEEGEHNSLIIGAKKQQLVTFNALHKC